MYLCAYNPYFYDISWNFLVGSKQVSLNGALIEKDHKPEFWG